MERLMVKMPHFWKPFNYALSQILSNAQAYYMLIIHSFGLFSFYPIMPHYKRNPLKPLKNIAFRVLYLIIVMRHWGRVPRIIGSQKW